MNGKSLFFVVIWLNPSTYLRAFCKKELDKVKDRLKVRASNQLTRCEHKKHPDKRKEGFWVDRCLK